MAWGLYGFGVVLMATGIGLAAGLPSSLIVLGGACILSAFVLGLAKV